MPLTSLAMDEESGGLTRLAEEFRVLDARRRAHGLAHADVDRYYSLFTRLSEALTAGERRRRMDARQFLRVRCRVDIAIKTGPGERLAPCHEIGGGGCAIEWPDALRVRDHLILDGAVVEGRRYPLGLRAEVMWIRPPGAGDGAFSSYGLRFFIDGVEGRDQVDRVFYRVLDLFLNAATPARASGATAEAPVAAQAR